MTAAVEVHALTRRFGGLAAVDDVTLEVARGEFHAIIGANGAGKTTLFNLISGALAPSAGVIRIDGVDVTRLPPFRRARLGVGRTFQINNVFLSKTVAANIRVAILARERGIWRFWSGIEGRHAVEIADIAQAVGLGAHVATPAAGLSHGDRRRLELAIAVAGRPSLLLLDEPTCGMSAEERPALVALIRQLVAKRRLTAILVEHDMDVVFAVAERVTVMHRGRIVAQGAPRDIAADAQVRELYLGGGFHA